MTKTDTFVCWRDAGHKTETTRWGWNRCAECGAGPQYYERKADPSIVLSIVVPSGTNEAKKLRAVIARGSAIVAYSMAKPLEGVDTHLSYEGFIHRDNKGLTARELWRMGLLHAADRMVTEYPSAAKRLAHSDDLAVVGTYTPSALNADPMRDPIDITDEETLARWLQETA